MNRHELREQTRLNLSANFSGNNKNRKKMNFLTKRLSFTAENKIARDLKIAILPGTFKDAAEIKRVFPDVDAVITDGNVIEIDGNALTVKSNNNKTLEHLKNFARFVNSEFVGFDIQTDSRFNFGFNFEFTTTTPFNEQDPFVLIPLSNSVSTMQNDNHRAVVENKDLPRLPNGRRGIPYNSLTMFVFSIRANSEMTINIDVRTS